MNVKIGNNEYGFCGLVKNENGKLIRFVNSQEAIAEFYYNPHPTNCIASWICAASGKGYPKFSYCKGYEIGYYNLAVFYGSCNFNCLFCQNWHFKFLTYNKKPKISASELANKVNEKVSCICFFGGNPGPQILHAIKVSKLALKKY